MSYAQTSFEHTSSFPFASEVILVGKGWRLGNYFAAVTSGNYASISFHTPLGMKSIYNFADIGKTGGTLSITMVEGGTITGGTALTPWNLNRDFSTKTCELTNVKYGVTISGGVSAPPRYIGGEAQGNQIPGGSASGDSFIYLKPDTDYTIKANALTNTTAINIVLDIGVNI